MIRPTDIQTVTRAADFAARRHTHQRRRGEAAGPYFNHLAHVASLLADAGADADLVAAGYRKRETFAYACEAYSCIVAPGSTAADRRAALDVHADGGLPGDDSIDLDEYIDNLQEAVVARNGWKRILQRCAPRESRTTTSPITG